MFRRLHDIIEGSWYGPSWLSLLLLPLAWVFGLVSACRRWAYKSGILPAPVLPVPVIVVGNISVGGTGKTPIVIWLARHLVAQGYRPGIVSRGYGGSHRGPPSMVHIDDDPQLTGDEPLMLARVTGVPVCIAKDRVAGVQSLAASGVDVVVADDGLQHYRMVRQAELIVIDGERGVGNGRLLPSGPLREAPARLHTADAVLVNGASSDFSGFSFSLEGDVLTNLADSSERDLADFAGKQVWVVAGIGNPERFYKRLEAAGVRTVPVPLTDHGVTRLEELINRQDQPILMTAKDAVKYGQNPPANAWFLGVEAQFSASDTAEILRIITTKLS